MTAGIRRKNPAPFLESPQEKSGTQGHEEPRNPYQHHHRPHYRRSLSLRERVKVLITKPIEPYIVP